MLSWPLKSVWTNVTNCAGVFTFNFPGDQAPDLNITVSPSILLQVGTEINISCEAGISRFQDKNTRPLPISRITIQFGDNTIIKECTSQGPGMPKVNICTDTTTLKNAATQNLVICTAKSDAGCRFKVVNITFIEKETSK